MGFMDALNAEDRVGVKFSTLYDLLYTKAEAELLKNAMQCEVPYRYVREMLSGVNDELESYRGTGLTVERMEEMDRIFQEKCREVADLQSRLDEIVVKQYEEAEGEKVIL